MSFTTLTQGFDGAVRRFSESLAAGGGAATFIPLFESLNWAVSILEFLEKQDRPILTDTAKALRFVRNRVHHQWADATFSQDVLVPRQNLLGGTRGGVTVISPVAVRGWFWRAAEFLPAAERPDSKGEDAYKAVLAGRPVREGLDALAADMGRSSA